MRAMTGEFLRYWAAHLAAAECQTALAKQGLKVAVTVDPGKIRDSVDKVGKPYLTPILDPAQNDFSESNYFWMIASREGEPVIVGGGRLDHMAQGASAHIARGLNRAYGAGTIIDVSSDVSKHLQGRVCYLGDLYSKSVKGLSRNNVRHFLGVANFIAATQFQADYTYSFMRRADVMRGSADVNGFDRRIYKPVQWGSVPTARCDSEIIAYRSATSDEQYFDGIMQELAPRATISTADLGDQKQVDPA